MFQFEIYTQQIYGISNIEILKPWKTYMVKKMLVCSCNMKNKLSQIIVLYTTKHIAPEQKPNVDIQVGILPL